RRVLLEGTLPQILLVHHLMPAPDGQLILASLREARTKTSWIHVVQPDGKVLVKVDAGSAASGGLSR
ncbi:MAG: hypothetical protein Q8K78_18355, partial [Planctomycetaceae bacterium]|nr:hypothetical protein [Planctomycetaceae bacterium]